MHRGLYVSMSHRLHDGGQVPSPHENPCAVVMFFVLELREFRGLSRTNSREFRETASLDQWFS
jgi:hypothetical protein